MKAYLYQLNQTFPKFELEEYFTIGEDSSCNWRIDEASSRHAHIMYREPHFYLKDSRSEAGTFLNDQRIQEAPLQEGDWIQIANQEIQFSLLPQKEQKTFSLKSRNQQWNEKLQQLTSVAQSEHSILILGPSGTGKEVLTQAIHKTSKRFRGPIVCVNCSALSESLIESELFGHTKGSFTGAINDRKGAFEAARGGTLFLDEIGDLPLHLQAKLLRALENNEIRPVGSDQNIETDIRVIAATHQNLIEKVHTKEFRADLYYRLNVITLQTPALIDRMEDFEELLYSFAKLMKVRFSFAAIQKLKNHSWPGNIRELRNSVARASALFPRLTIDEDMTEQVIDKVYLEKHSDEIKEACLQPLPMIKEMEKQLIIRKLAAHKGNQRRTAMDLGLPKSTLHDRLKAYNIDPRSFAR